jgi:long-subunit acyl-CoA synthetase (AMP-forming)
MSRTEAIDDHGPPRGTADGAIAIDELRRRGTAIRPAAVRQRLSEVDGDNLATLAYTSGITGPPKGCMLGAISDDGFVSITGRKKALIITSSGKKITPSNIENLLRQSPKRWCSVIGARTWLPC